ncbi:DUF2560 family protein [Serratia inhibens]
MSEITQADSIRLKILVQVGYDTAAAAQAIEFVSDDPLKAAIFDKQYSRVDITITEVIARTTKAIQESKEALMLFDTPAA